MFVVVSMTLRVIAGFAVMAATLFAQETLEFEVASIRPSAPIVQNANTQVSAGVHIDGRQFRSSTLTMRDYLSMAYTVRIYQIEGPDWITSTRFDINAKMPELPEGQRIDEKGFGVMVRKLIEDRFPNEDAPRSKGLPGVCADASKRWDQGGRKPARC